MFTYNNILFVENSIIKLQVRMRKHWLKVVPKLDLYLQANNVQYLIYYYKING